MEHGGQRTGAGRPKGSKAAHSLEAEALRQYVIEQVVKNKEAIVASLIKQAIEGKIPAAKELLERTIGKPVDMGEILDEQQRAELNRQSEAIRISIEQMKEVNRQQRIEFKKKFGRDPLVGQEPYWDMI